MKIFISADIEGTCGVCDREEVDITTPSCMYHRIQMSKEVNAACVGANDCSSDYILVKDAHGSARNIIPDMLDENASIFRGWSGDPLGMMSGIDSSFDAAMFIGYHSGATLSGNPLSHTKNSRVIDYLKINDKLADEFTVNSYTAAYYDVPVVFISGDEMLCEDVLNLNPNIKTSAVSKGIGSASISINPNVAIKNIQAKVKEALSEDLSKYKISLPENFKVELRFKDHHKAYRASFYPGVSLIDSRTILFETNDYMDVLKLLLFTV